MTFFTLSPANSVQGEKTYQPFARLLAEKNYYELFCKLNYAC